MLNFDLSFIGDNEKMKDYHQYRKQAFLIFYSYLSEQEYDETKRIADRISEIKRELETLLAIAASNGKPTSENFETICSLLNGHNNDGELFDFNYKEICSTVHLDAERGLLRLSDTCEIYNDTGECDGLINDCYIWTGGDEA